MNKFDLNYLKYFYFVVTLNGFTKAADSLHVQQPVISRAVKLLEEQLGFKLIERQKKQVILTTEGKEIFKMAQKMFDSADQISAFAKERLGNISGDLCFATSDSLAPEIMGPILKAFIQRHPSMRPIHHAGPASLLLDKISAGAIEFGIFFNVPELPMDLEKSKLAHVPFDFVISKEFAKNKKTTESFIASKEQDDEESFRLPLFQKYRSHHKNVSIAAISSSSMARKAMAISGVGVTILPRFLVQEDIKKGLLKSLHEGEYSLPLYLVERKSSYKSKLKNELLSLMKDMVEA
ncbi:LysR family transcriptional regulator [Bdellovibrio svalbardensis]|uniref:LysR family transcriptional regulator n=1 Tax=Bdellovibrio svalbardensis TaxID=2972972 RepID=A0ABT6DMF5_9BACT|nr:LysR family transcriptional regulator [Bdellovibrio svalbardensis]MDG0817682.1 LysR family transcriptional regulator [Bdellovibrio svalbardensis]